MYDMIYIYMIWYIYIYWMENPQRFRSANQLLPFSRIRGTKLLSFGIDASASWQLVTWGEKQNLQSNLQWKDCKVSMLGNANLIMINHLHHLKLGILSRASSRLISQGEHLSRSGFSCRFKAENPFRASACLVEPGLVEDLDPGLFT